LKKLFKHAKPNNWKILEKDMVDEFIFRTENPRDRLILELMARGGMRVSEVLKITPNDVDDRKISDLEAMRWIDKDTQNRSFYIGEVRLKIGFYC
jgi:site-specific recombinase XerD